MVSVEHEHPSTEPPIGVVRYRRIRWTMGTRFFVAVVALIAVAMQPQAARAGNMTHLRTPVEWPSDTSCIEFVDRSVDARYTFTYGIPFEDLDITADEVSNSRTHQFFALCRQHSTEEFLPRWISPNDVEDASVFGLVDPATLDADDLLETNAAWDGCWFRITGDDERRSISLAAASEPVVWDTSEVPAGTYTVEGYTYEPTFNLWRPRNRNVVRVYDGGDPKQLGPAATLDPPESDQACVGQMVELRACVDAVPGTTATAEYAITGTAGSERPDFELPWFPFASDEPVNGSTLSIPWLVPDAVGGETITLRLRLEDPSGRTYVAYGPSLWVILQRSNPGCAVDPSECDAGFVVPPECADGGAPTDGSDETSTATTEAGFDDADADNNRSSGCTCSKRAPHRAVVGWFGTWLVFGVWNGRRRRLRTAPLA